MKIATIIYAANSYNLIFQNNIKLPEGTRYVQVHYYIFYVSTYIIYGLISR